MHSTKILPPSSNLGSKVKVTDKCNKVQHFLGAVLGGASCVVCQFYTVVKTNACCRVIVFTARAMLSLQALY